MKYHGCSLEFSEYFRKKFPKLIAKMGEDSRISSVVLNLEGFKQEFASQLVFLNKITETGDLSSPYIQTTLRELEVLHTTWTHWHNLLHKMEGDLS